MAKAGDRTITTPLSGNHSALETATDKTGTGSEAVQKANVSDEELLGLIQKQTVKYFWDWAHSPTGMALDWAGAQHISPNNVLAVGGTGFGVMAIIVAVERGWIPRAEAVDRLLGMLCFLGTAESYNGVYPHFLDPGGKEISGWADNAGGDLVETSYLIAGFLCARQYFQSRTAKEAELRHRINVLWRNVNWNWHTLGSDVLFWHWSPTHQRGPHQRIEGWNECLITYVLAASSPTFPIRPGVYHEGWAKGDNFINGNSYYDLRLPLGPRFGGPLFFAHFSFLGLDPRGLKDRYADYWQQNLHHTLINYEHCVRNPNGFRGYGSDCWGLTASDGDAGYFAHDPGNDRGVIAPTAALSSFPYTPAQSIRALRNFTFGLGSRIWADCGFVDAFNPTTGWRSTKHLAINQGPIVVMIENYRSGLLWRLFMSCREIRHGLRILGFERVPAEQRGEMH